MFLTHQFWSHSVRLIRKQEKAKSTRTPTAPSLGQSELLSPRFSFLKKKIYLFETPEHLQSHTHTHRTRLRCRSQPKTNRGTSYLLLLGRQTCIYFHSFSYALTLLAFHSFFLFMWGRNAPADVFLHCDWLIKKLLWLNCAPPPHTALHLRSAILLSPHLLLLFFFVSTWSNDLCVRVLASWYWLRYFA